MRQLRAFLMGMREFRSCYTLRYPYSQALAYDRGREFAHLLTLRQFDY